ncbi:unnamed protein product [Fraxinus pennsylvanica]|uniref:Uncharacterized protein n=1 Tax=Fraxinus pennsylvanica TaxID=56036 RepID=A0AAD1ZMG9_9LAMI|nr:unnamed protein product [Fraxinus pennsylvanica]
MFLNISSLSGIICTAWIMRNLSKLSREILAVSFFLVAATCSLTLSCGRASSFSEWIHRLSMPSVIIDYKLPYRSGTATTVLINGFHTAKGNKMAKKQVHGFLKFFSFSFLWSFFQWFYSGGQQCEFINFPTFGLKAWRQTFYFDFSMTYIGAGMICSHLVNLSLLLSLSTGNTKVSPLYLEEYNTRWPYPLLSKMAILNLHRPS